jgi:SAM-dependent methyltransferase
MSDALRNNLRRAYAAQAGARDQRRIQPWKLAERNAFIARLQAEGKTTLLEIGAGPGRDGRHFRQQALAVVCTDLSPAMIHLCRQKGLDAAVVYGGYDYEGIWEDDPSEPQRFFSFYGDAHLRRVVGAVFDVVSFKRVPFAGKGAGLHFQSLTLRKGPDTGEL